MSENDVNQREEFSKQILQNINTPKELEKLYRQNKDRFKESFLNIFNQIENQPIAQVWFERLNYPTLEANWGSKQDWIFILTLVFVNGFIAKIPDLFSINKEFFFSRNIGFIVFPVLMIYFSRKLNLSIKSLIFPFFIVLGTIFFINSLPDKQSDILNLTVIHLPIFLWTILGFIYVGANIRSSTPNIHYLRYNGDLVVMGVLIGLSAGLFSALTIGLFSLIGIDISEFYRNYIITWGLPAIPVFASYLIQNNPQLVNKISPTIASIFTPLVFVTLLIFLGTLIYTGKSLHQDREFLLLFNALLIGVMAIIIFSLSEITKTKHTKFHIWILFGLSLLSILSNTFALNAIIVRLLQYGVTPNRMAVLGANILIFSNLLLVSYQLFKSIKNENSLANVEKVIGLIVPMIAIWASIVSFIFPIVF